MILNEEKEGWHYVVIDKIINKDLLKKKKLAKMQKS